jgi:hypothetical protein
MSCREKWSWDLLVFGLEKWDSKHWARDLPTTTTKFKMVMGFEQDIN